MVYKNRLKKDVVILSFCKIIVDDNINNWYVTFNAKKLSIWNEAQTRRLI